MFKETNDSRQLLQGNFRVDTRRILQIFPRRGENFRNLPLARDCGFHPFLLRREIAADNREQAIRYTARIIVGILLPTTDISQGEQIRSNPSQNQIAIRRGRERRELALEAREHVDLRLNATLRIVFELRIVLVEAVRSCGGWIEMKVVFVEEPVGQSV